MTRQLLPVFALFVSTAFLLAGGGMQAVLLPVRGQIEGFSASQIGFIGAGWAIGFTVGCIIVPHLVRRVGHVRTFSALAAILATVVLLNGMIIEANTWIVLRALAGFCFSGSYMIIESWLNERITNESRGAMFSIYMVISQAAYMAGQYLLVVANPERETLFMVGAILYCLAVLPTALSKAQSPAPLTQVQIDLKSMFFNSPAAFIGALVIGTLAGSFQSFAPVYGVAQGMSSTNIANMMACVMLGAVIFQFPLGKASDLVDRRFVMVGLSLGGTLAGFSVPLFASADSQPSYTFFATMVVLGGFIYPLYGLVTAYANDHAEPEDFVKISSSLLILYGIGSIIGPLVTGPIMEFFGSQALFQTIGATHFLLAIYLTYRITRREAPQTDDQTMDYQPMPFAVGQTTETYSLDPRSDADTYLSSPEEDENEGSGEKER
ncbi:MAG: MFS transporter [Rhizobiaceae bacterium]|jgi:MFS family permease|nr:MFS transporter [Rhizobiaceae bacterium]